MEQYWKILGGMLVALVLGLVLRPKGKEIAFLLTLVMCCGALVVAMGYLEPVVDFLRQLQTVGKLDNSMIRIMLKAVGVGLTAEIAALICADSGNAALGKAVQILASTVILWLALPLMQGFLSMIQKIVGEV